MNDEPGSWLALAGVLYLFAQQAFGRWMTWKERKTGGTIGTLKASGERGSLTNGVQVRLTALESDVSRLRENQDKLWVKLDQVNDLCARIDERTKSG